MDLHPTNTLVVTGTTDGKFFALLTPCRICFLEEFQKKGIVYLIFLLYRLGHVLLWNIDKRIIINEHEVHGSTVHTVAFSPGKPYLSRTY